jgi:beta-galactosidase GanA
MSSYAPLWVKQDYERFPRVQVRGEGSVEIITTFSHAAREADTKAYVALMRRIRELDSKEHTVIMIQMQNEVGVLGDSRDRSPVAEKAFAQPIPPKLLEYMRQNKDKLIPELHQLWASTDFRASGSWEEVFGSGPSTDEVFMAWHYARYMDKITAAGKAEYPLPVFANAWLSGSIFGVNELPGAWPSGGPLPSLMDVWRAAAPNIDFIAPDIYQPNFEEWCDRYTQLGNPLYIPETSRTEQGARNIFFSYG